MTIKKKIQLENLLITIKQTLINNKFYLDVNHNIHNEFEQMVGPLAGITYDLKLNFLTKQYKSDAASNMLKNFIPSYNCQIYDYMQNNGALFIGKTNCDELASGSLGVNSAYGPVYYKNIYTGGSSSGSAYTSKNIVDISFGTDTGGSCRLPAMFTRVFSYKPSFGGISRYGIIEYDKSLDTIGCLYRNPNIMRKVFDRVVQHDIKDSLSIPITKHIDNNFNFLIFNKNKFNENEIPILDYLQKMHRYEYTNILFNSQIINAIYSLQSSINIFF